MSDRQSAAVPEVLDFISGAYPLDRLPPSVAYAIATASEICFHPRGSTILTVGDHNTHLHLIRTGAVEQQDPDGELRSRLGESEFFGRQSAISGEPAAYTAIAIEDVVLYRFGADVLHQLARTVPDVLGAFAGQEAQRLRHAIDAEAATTSSAILPTTPTSAIITQAAVCVSPDATVREVAVEMGARRTSMACVLEGDGRLVGVVSDHDFRERVVAEGLGPDIAVSTVMSPEPITTTDRSSSFDTMMIMVQHDIRHVPVQRGDRIVGVVSAADLFRDHHSMQAIDLAGRIARARSTAELAELAAGRDGLQVSLVRAGLPPRQVTHVCTSIVDACTKRLLVLAERDLGPPPTPYVWLGLGSHARAELTATSDQDNALVFDDMGLVDDEVRADGEHYFSELARRVCTGLAACGLRECDGGFMATNPRWRQPISQWLDYYRTWIAEAELEALLNITVFLDVRPVHGDDDLAARLSGQLRDSLRGQTRFLQALVTNALRVSPPLGFFRTFVVSRGDEGQRVLDVKRRGQAPVVDLARIHAMAAGLSEPHTYRRLEGAEEMGRLSATSADDLRNALMIISRIRLEHQSDLLERELPVHDDLVPGNLTPYQQGHLKEAFAIVRSAQTVLRQSMESGALARRT